MTVITFRNAYFKIIFLSFQILQNLGKVDRTADDIFDEHLQNFTKQHNAATRLQKEFNNYIRCIRGMFTFICFKNIYYDNNVVGLLKVIYYILVFFYF